jgi:uncharacterized protein (TIGR03067 family)
MDKDLAAMQGIWRLESTRRDGVEAAGKATYVFENATLTVYPENRRESFYTLAVHSDSRPKQLDIVATWPDGRSQKAEAIYELSEGELRWCHVDGRRGGLSECKPEMAGTVITLRRR